MVEQYFRNIIFSIPEEVYEIALAVFNDYPIQGIEEQMDALMVSFLDADYSEDTQNSILADLQSYNIQSSILRDERVLQKNWNELWERSVEPIVISPQTTITPEWHRESVSAKNTIIINPKMSFGTGYHPTTRMTARLMEEYVLPGTQWIDAGTGTGVLAILASKLGAKSVFAFDNDVWSVENTQENFHLNSTPSAVTIQQADIFTIQLPICDGICANMYRNVLIPSFPKLYNCLQEDGNPLIISGILKYDIDDVISAAGDTGFIHISTVIEDEWSAMVFIKGSN